MQEVRIVVAQEAEGCEGKIQHIRFPCRLLFTILLMDCWCVTGGVYERVWRDAYIRLNNKVLVSC